MPSLFSPVHTNPQDLNRFLQKMLAGSGEVVDSNVLVHPVKFDPKKKLRVVITSPDNPDVEIVNYNDPPQIQQDAIDALEGENREAFNRLKADLDKGIGGYNGKHLLVKKSNLVKTPEGLLELRLECVRTQYHVIKARQLRILPALSSDEIYYTFGVQMPLLTTDNKLVLVTSTNRLGLIGAPQGTAEPIDTCSLPSGSFREAIERALASSESGPSSDPGAKLGGGGGVSSPVLKIEGADIALLTAWKELWEEVFGNSPRGNEIFKGCKFNPVASAVVYHFSKAAKMPSMLNLIIPVDVPLTLDELLDYLQHSNKSVDAAEISNNLKDIHVIDLSSGKAFWETLAAVLSAAGEGSLHICQLLLAVLPKKFSEAVLEMRNQSQAGAAAAPPSPK
jgi:hypothetical protein